MTGNRIAAFVSAARSLLVVQVIAALLAVGVTAWAFFEVRGVVAERNQLRARVAELEAQAAQPQQPLTPVPLGPDPLMNQILPPEVLAPETGPVLPDAGNVVVPTTPPDTAEPGNTVTPPGRWDQRPPTTRPPVTTPPRLDCAGADRANPRCRPIPERPPVQQVPDRLTPRGEPLTPQQQPPTLTRPQPQRPTPQAPSRAATDGAAPSEAAAPDQSERGEAADAPSTPTADSADADSAHADSAEAADSAAADHAAAAFEHSAASGRHGLNAVQA